MRSATASEAAANKFLIEGPGPRAWIHNYIDDGRKDPSGNPRQPGDLSPMIYLVDQEPDSSIPMHFHQVDQFQIVVGGSGKIGRYPLAPVTVHYTNAFTGYGPLNSGEAGLQYLTIRARWDPGLRPLPEAKDELPKAGTHKQRHRISDPAPPLSAGELEVLERAQTRTLLDEGDDEAGAWLVAIPPDGSAHAPSGTANERVLVVVGGELAMPMAKGTLHSCHYLEAGEPDLLRAGRNGAEVLVLRFRDQP